MNFKGIGQKLLGYVKRKITQTLMAKNSLTARLDFTEVMTLRPQHIHLNCPLNNLPALAHAELGRKDFDEKVRSYVKPLH